MARVLKETKLSTRAARSQLSPDATYWRGLDQDVHLGYRKALRGGRWIVRWRVGAGYRQVPLGGADDVIAADGVESLTFDQALRAARLHVEHARRPAPIEAVGPLPTVQLAADAHADALERRHKASGRSVLRDCRSRFRNHVSSDAIASIELPKLTVEQLKAWRGRLLAKGLSAASVKRIVADLRAALNEAADRYRSLLPPSFRTQVADGLALRKEDAAGAETRPNVILSDTEWSRLLEAAEVVDAKDGWDGHLYKMILGLAATGARFSQLMRCRVPDLIVDRRLLMVPVSWKGRGQKQRKFTPHPLTDEVIEALQLATAGRRGSDPLFMRWGFRRGNKLRWEKDALREWRPSELTAPFAKIVAEAKLPSDVTAYSLRHTSIVRCLGLGLPVRLVASMHDTSSEMIERFYSAHILDALSELTQRAAVSIRRAAA